MSKGQDKKVSEPYKEARSNWIEFPLKAVFNSPHVAIPKEGNNKRIGTRGV